MAVMRLDEIAQDNLRALLRRYGLQLERVPGGATIPASYWGESEAGLRGNVLYARADTPLHSVLHEACHWICMPPERRAGLDTDALGDDLEECAVNYLQILLADELPGYGGAQMFSDMDAWGYSFRLGSAKAWFQHDADDARRWLFTRGLVDAGSKPAGVCLREEPGDERSRFRRAQGHEQMPAAADDVQPRVRQ